MISLPAQRGTRNVRAAYSPPGPGTGGWVPSLAGVSRDSGTGVGFPIRFRKYYKQRLRFSCANGARVRRGSWRVAAVSHVKGAAHAWRGSGGWLGNPSRCSGPLETEAIRHGRAGCLAGWACVRMLQNKVDKEPANVGISDRSQWWQGGGRCHRLGWPGWTSRQRILHGSSWSLLTTPCVRACRPAPGGGRARVPRWVAPHGSPSGARLDLDHTFVVSRHLANSCS